MYYGVSISARRVPFQLKKLSHKRNWCNGSTLAVQVRGWSSILWSRSIQLKSCFHILIFITFVWGGFASPIHFSKNYLKKKLLYTY